MHDEWMHFLNTSTSLVFVFFNVDLVDGSSDGCIMGRVDGWIVGRMDQLIVG